MDVSSSIGVIPNDDVTSIMDDEVFVGLTIAKEINEKRINAAREKYKAEYESQDDSKSEDDDSESEGDDLESEGDDLESEEFEDHESKFHNNRSLSSEGDKSVDFSADQNKLEDSDTGLSSHHHSDILKEMKLLHEKEILSYKQNINELQSKLNAKTEEAEDLTLKNSELQKQYQQLLIEKNECINKMSEEFAAQKKCQLFLESGVIEEINRLKLQVQCLEEGNSNFERENSLLKESFFSRWTRSLFALVGFPFWLLKVMVGR